jgi:hypothetical protein
MGTSMKRNWTDYFGETGFIKPLAITLLSFLIMVSCKKEDNPDPLLPYEVALAIFVADLEANPPDSAGLSDRVRNYMAAQSPSFFGATVALLDSAGKAYYSPYWYRLNDTLAMKNLADPVYQIDEQMWLRMPIDSGIAIWTDPYFDAGGGEVWMRTRAVPVYINNEIVAVATSDIEVEEP